MMRTPEWLRSQSIDETGRERISWWRVIALVLGLVGVVAFLIILISDFKPDEVEKVPEKVSSRWKEPEITFDAEAIAAEPEAVNEELVETEQQAEDEEDSEPDPRIEILAALGRERFTPFQMDHKRVAEFQEFSKVSGGGGCDIMPGTTAKLRPDGSLNTDNGGTITAVLVEPVPGADGCIALNSGAVFTGVVDTNVNFGQSRANVVFTSITDGGRDVAIQAQAGDATGSGGVPGRVDRHMLSKGIGVALATGVDLAKFAFAGGSNGFGIIVGNTGSVMDDFARQYVNRKDTITSDPSDKNAQIITVTFTQRISL